MNTHVSPLVSTPVNTLVATPVNTSVSAPAGTPFNIPFKIERGHHGWFRRTGRDGRQFVRI